MTKQEFAKVVQAWADGETVQYRRYNNEDRRDASSEHWVTSQFDRRIKPKTVQWRVALIQPSGYAKPYPTLVENDEWGERMEQSSIFVRWLNGWQEDNV